LSWCWLPSAQASSCRTTSPPAPQPPPRSEPAAPAFTKYSSVHDCLLILSVLGYYNFDRPSHPSRAERSMAVLSSHVDSHRVLLFQI
jgi:hypothetical protein